MLHPFLAVAFAAAAAPSPVTGAPGQPVRIVALAPSLAELVVALDDKSGGALDGKSGGALDEKSGGALAGASFPRLIGAAERSALPLEYAGVKQVGPYHAFSVEAVAALKPDLVLATRDGNPADRVRRLEELGFRTVVVSTASIREIREAIEAVGAACGRLTEARKIADSIRDKVSELRAAPGRRRRVFLQVGDDPLVSVGPGSFLHEALEIAGAENVMGDAGAAYPRPSRETVVASRPELILVMAMGEDLAPFRRMAEAWSRFPGLKARVLRSDALLRPGIGLVRGLEDLRAAISGSAR